MADKTLYDVLEVSASASPESIRAAYERLSAKLDPDHSGNAPNPGARMQYDARRDKDMAERRAENQRRVDEQRSHQQAQAQVARERAELCRIERERYGKAISC